MKRTAVFSLFPFYIFNEEQFKFFNFLKLQKKKKAQIETSLCSAVTARRNGGRKSRPVRREDGGYAEGEKEEGGGEKGGYRKGNGGEGKSKRSHSCSIFPAV